VVENYRVLAAAHLLRYASRPDVSDYYRGAGSIAWFLTQPDHTEAATLVLDAADDSWW